METTIMKTNDDAFERRRDAFVERLLGSTAGMFEIFTVYIGHRLGLYKALQENGPMTPAELAGATGTYERYVREWLEQQTVTGILEAEDARAPSESRRYRLDPAHAEVLVDRDSLNYLSPLAQLAAGAVRPLPALLDAFRTGKGVPYTAYGTDAMEGIAGMNRPMFLKLLGGEWLPAIPDVHARLGADPPARVADVGCGQGWSSIGIARAYPKVYVDGFDLDEASVDAAVRNVRDAGLDERVRIRVQDASDPDLRGRYDLVTAFECLHDMADPVGALRNMLRLTGPGGAVLIMDERVAPSFGGEGNDVEWLMYGFSVLHCLPVGKEDEPSAETGTVLRSETLERYAAAAGFCDVEILPIENYFFRFYRLKAVC